MAVRAVSKIFDKVIFKNLRNTIKKNPHLGLVDEDGNLVFKRGDFVFKYRLIGPAGQKEVEFISAKRRLRVYEQKVENLKRGFSNLWIYGGWIDFFRPVIFFPLVSMLLILYFVVFEPADFKLQRARWGISRLLRVPVKSVTVKPDGWVTISGQRKTAVDKQIETISYNINPFNWLTFLGDGYIFRDRSRGYGIVSYPVYDNGGKINLKKEGQWIAGEPDLGKIEWKKPQGTGIRAGKVAGHDELSSESGILVSDKEP